MLNLTKNPPPTMPSIIWIYTKGLSSILKLEEYEKVFNPC